MKKAVSILSVGMLCVIEIMTSFSYAVTSQVSVTFNSNGGSEVEGIEVEYGQKIEAPADPTRDGYEFKGRAVEVKYKVTYVVNPAKGYGMPEGFEVPTDLRLYAPGEMVNVKSDLTTEVDYAYNSEGEKVSGTWEFVTWDKADFEITEDTTVTGGWVFTPAPAETYTYIVHYKLYEGNPDGGIELNNPTSGEVDALNTTVSIDAIPVKSLSNKKYRTKVQIYPGFQHVDVKITHDNFVITIWYLPKNTGMVANPNSVATSGIKEEVIEEEEKEEVIVLFGMVGNQIGELLGDPEGNYRYWDFENDEFYYDTELIAVWEPIIYTISYEGVDGLENSNPTEYTVETEAFDLTALEKDGYIFEGWYTSDGKQISQIVQGSTGNLVLHPQRKDPTPKYSGGGSHRSKATKTEDTHGAAKKSEDKATVIDEVIDEVKEVVSDKVAEKTTENNVDKEELKAEESTVEESTVGESTEDFNDSYVTYVEPKETLDSDISNKSELGNTAEMVEAYNFAHENGITTKETFEDADTDGLLNRKELAKMLSQFAINVMGMEPEEGKAGCESFRDTKGESSEMKGYMKTACELGLMGLESDGITVANHFDPNKSVTRAEFGTTLSRLLYGGVNNLHDDLDRMNNEWYEKHLRALQDNGIMTQVSGEWVKKIELRGYVMLMLMRSANN